MTVASTVCAPAVAAPAPRGLCTDCGVSRSATPTDCGQACQFIAPDYPGLEARVHGRARDPSRHGTYGIHTFDWAADWAARAKPAAMAANCAHPARMVLGPGGL